MTTNLGIPTQTRAGASRPATTVASEPENCQLSFKMFTRDHMQAVPNCALLPQTSDGSGRRAECIPLYHRGNKLEHRPRRSKLTDAWIKMMSPPPSVVSATSMSVFGYTCPAVAVPGTFGKNSGSQMSGGVGAGGGGGDGGDGGDGGGGPSQGLVLVAGSRSPHRHNVHEVKVQPVTSGTHVCGQYAR
jgi:hypothetical protein